MTKRCLAVQWFTTHAAAKVRNGYARALARLTEATVVKQL